MRETDEPTTRSPMWMTEHSGARSRSKCLKTPRQANQNKDRNIVPGCTHTRARTCAHTINARRTSTQCRAQRRSLYESRKSRVDVICDLHQARTCGLDSFPGEGGARHRTSPFLQPTHTILQPTPTDTADTTDTSTWVHSTHLLLLLVMKRRTDPCIQLPIRLGRQE